MRKGARATGTRGPDGKNIVRTEGHFTNTAVPRFNGGGCWQQHLKICQAIVKSNGWTNGTAALKLFAHLDGEALNVALLMPEDKRGKMGRPLTRPFGWRKAVFRRQFESAPGTG